MKHKQKKLKYTIVMRTFVTSVLYTFKRLLDVYQVNSYINESIILILTTIDELKMNESIIG